MSPDFGSTLAQATRMKIRFQATSSLVYSDQSGVLSSGGPGSSQSYHSNPGPRFGQQIAVLLVSHDRAPAEVPAFCTRCLARGTARWRSAACARLLEAAAHCWHLSASCVAAVAAAVVARLLASLLQHRWTATGSSRRMHCKPCISMDRRHHAHHSQVTIVPDPAVFLLPQQLLIILGVAASRFSTIQIV